MKKFTVLVALFVMTLAVTGCPGGTPPAGDPTPTPVVVVDPTPIPPVPTVVPPVPTEVPTPVPVASWWPQRPAGVPVNFVYCPMAGPSGGGPEDDWRLRSACTYDPYIQR